MKIKHKTTTQGRCSAIELARLIIPAIALAVTSTHAAEVYNSDFTVDPVVDGEVNGGWWTDTSGASSVAYDGTNDQVDYVHIAATNSRWVNYDTTRTTVNVGYMKVVVSNFVNTSDPSDPDGPWLGFNYTNRGNTGHWASLDITQNGTYEIMFNNSLAPVSFDNGAGWSGTLPAGTGLASLDNGVNEVPLEVGGSVVAGGAWRGFGVIAAGGNTGVFPGATLSLDSIEVHDTVNLGTGNNAPVFNADPFQKADGEQDVAYVGSIATDASDADLDTLSFTKDSGPSWLSIASNGDLTGTPLVGDIGYNLFDVSVSDGNGGMDSATLVIGVGAPSSETTIVDWGLPNPFDATIVSANTGFTLPPLAYDGSDAIGDTGTYYAGVDAANKSKVFSAATSASGVYQIQDSGYDRIRIINDADNTDHETMIAWEDENWSAPHGGDQLLSMTMGGFESGDSLNQYSFIIQTSAGWFSTAMSTWAGAQTFTLPDVTAVDWFSFSATMNTDGATNVGGTILSPDFSDVISVGFYFHSADNGVDVSGLQVGHFQATVGNPGGIPNTDPVFTADPTVAVTAGVAGEAYTGETLAGSATDSDFGDSLTYSKVSGPGWLDVAPDGGLSGTPDAAGSPSTWTVQVTDSNGGTDTADLEITVTGSTTASMIVQWGLPNPYDASIVDGNQNFSATPPLTYDGSDAVGGAGAYYNGVGIANRSIVFAAASSATGGAFQIQESGGYDRIRIVNTASNAHETMVAWESSEWLNTLGGDSLESITMGGFESGAATNQYSFIIQTSAGWFSTAAAEWGGAQTFTLPDVSAVDWYSFTTTMNTDAATNIGGSILAPDFSDVISVGFYFHGADNSGITSGLQVGYFQATIDTPSAGYSDWAATNAGGQTIDQDFDLDGVANGIEYFMGETGSSFTALPVPDAAGTITYPMGATYAGAYGVDYYLESSSPDLSSWVTVDVGDVTIIGGTSISYTMPTGADAFFVRLVVLED